MSTLENWVLEWYYGSSELLTSGDRWTARRLASYVGATMIHLLGSSLTWSIRLAASAKAVRGLPVLAAAGKPEVRICPLLLVLGCADSRTGKVLATALAHATSVLGDKHVRRNDIEPKGASAVHAKREIAEQGDEVDQAGI